MNRIEELFDGCAVPLLFFQRHVRHNMLPQLPWPNSKSKRWNDSESSFQRLAQLVPFLLVQETSKSIFHILHHNILNRYNLLMFSSPRLVISHPCPDQCGDIWFVLPLLQVQQLKDKVAELQAVGPGCVNPTQSKASLIFFAILVPCWHGWAGAANCTRCSRDNRGNTKVEGCRSTGSATGEAACQFDWCIFYIILYWRKSHVFS